MHYQNRWCAGWKDCWWSAPRRGKQPSKCLLFRYCTSFFLLLLFQSDFCCFSWNQLIKLTESIKGRMTGIQKHMVEIQVCYWAQVAMFRVIWSHVHPIAMAKCNTSSCWYNMWCLYVVGGLCDIYLCVRVWNIRMRQSDGFESKEFVKNRNRARDCIKCILIEVAVFYCRFVKWKIKVWYNITIPSRWIPTAKRIIIDRSLTTFTLLSHAIRIGSCLHSFMDHGKTVQTRSIMCFPFQILKSPENLEVNVNFSFFIDISSYKWYVSNFLIKTGKQRYKVMLLGTAQTRSSIYFAFEILK